MGLLDGLFALGNQGPKNPIRNATLLPQPSQPELRTQYPYAYGLLGGLAGTAPDEMGGSVLDPKSAQVQAGARAGYPVGVGAQLLPLYGAAIKALGAPEKAGLLADALMQKTGMQLNAAPKNPVPTGSVFDLSDPLRSPSVMQAPVPRYDPPRGIPQRVQDLMKNRKAFNKAAGWTADGMTEDGLGWYNMEPLRLEFINRLGPEEGAKSFNQYIDLMAATSAGAKTNANARIASYYYVNGADGTPVAIPPLGSGYGHKAQNLHNTSANNIITGGGLDPIEHPKRFSFAENLKGNQEPVTVDKHNIRMWGMASEDPAWIAQKFEDPKGIGAPSWWDESKYGAFNPMMNPRQFVIDNGIKWGDIPPTWFEGAPTKTEYGALEELNKRLADKFGTTPAATQAASWLGAGPVTGLGSPPKSMMNTFSDVINQRAAARGQTPQEVLDQFIRRQRPLVVGGAATGLGYGLLDSSQPPD